jgi:hypothetical protein
MEQLVEIGITMFTGVASLTVLIIAKEWVLVESSYV